MSEDQMSDLNRRTFLKATGLAGLFLLFTSKLSARTTEKSVTTPPAFHGAKPPEDFNAYLHIAPDGRVTCYTGKIEMGQGIQTSLQQMLAEEMDVQLDSVDIVMGDTALCPYDMGTFGSMTTRFFGPPLRKAGAEARQVLLEMASEKLQIPIKKLNVENGIIFNMENPNQRISYGELTQGKRIERTAKGDVQTKSPENFKIMGQGTARKDGTEKVTGAAQYAADIFFPGMLYAKILRPSTYGGKLLQLDLSEAERSNGVTIVREGDFVAILHERPDGAEAAFKKITAQFSPSTSTSDENSIFEHLLKNAPPAKVIFEKGNVKKGAAHSKTTESNSYYNDYVAHAAIETHSAMVKIENKKAVVYASTQTPFVAQEQVAKELGFAKDDVHVVPVYLGGGFGGKSNYLQIVEAARCARLSGKPVQVSWTRQEEFLNDTFRPASVVKIKAGLDSRKRISLWDYEVFYAGERGADIFYEIPNFRVQSSGSISYGAPSDEKTPHPFAVGPWRGPGNNSNTHARESQMDVLAEKAKVDPVEFRLDHLAQKKERVVLADAAKRFGWVNHIGSSGKGIGVACAMDAGTFVTMMAEVAVDRMTGHITVKRVVCVQNMGLVVNPRGVRAQMEGSIIMGLGYALEEHVHFKNGQISDTNFSTYKIPRFSWIPRIDTHTIENQSADPQGGGEPSIVAMGAVIANAVYDAIGVRLYRLPMTPDRVLEAIKNKLKPRDSW